mgnify:CR=1 FL=1
MGCCLALELAQRGYRVDLVDLGSAPMTGASLHNEGKLHLGYVYANDPLKITHGLMLRGSLAFSHIIEKLTGCAAEALSSSQPFQYYVPIDSQLSMTAIGDHFHEVEQAIHEQIKNFGHLYFNRKYDRYFKQNLPDAHCNSFSPELTLGSFKTEERSVCTADVANILCRAVGKEPNINCILKTRVIAAERLSSGEVEIESNGGGKISRATYSCVANCLWDDRLRIDETAGIANDGPWISRYKATISISAPTVSCNRIPSATGILGPYGDVVNHRDGSYYISWYPWIA